MLFESNNLNNIQIQNILQQQKLQNNKKLSNQFTNYFNQNQNNNTNSNNNQLNINQKQIGIELYNIISNIGQGSYGNIYLVQHKNNKKYYAMKVLNKEQLINKNMVKYAITEKNVMRKCNSPFVVKIYHAFQTDKYLIIIIDYCPGGDLYQYLMEQKRFDEQLSLKYLCEVLIAVEELHCNNIIYRDMKPENIVLSTDGHIKLIDFGLSKECNGIGVASTFCGSAVYLAPEVISKKGHNKSVDWYQFGILAYELMVGHPPFNQMERKQLYYNIQNSKVEFPDFLSENAKLLIQQLLNKNPDERLGAGKNDAQEIKNHIFFKNVNWFDVQQKFFELPKPQCKQMFENKIEIDLNQNTLKQNNFIANWYYLNEEELIM
ncbi:protein kinase domain protein [Ichthyophthirius multifiliis]|uniref:Protein kinase domain protein n=1 Tax=Ichthyophthirius multifiliis TaxID=5932 RepID=G0QMA1_ICHMU|nr:protein kinase domain protein [Ichthyophthirius multifiliis]EGR33658.1 protein kinase domain protein [Ichthyophthirius multifiliis]|eukprot:XP_004037644.1 protein kinase domain protein [Ichthyophthirius multifiliis]